MYISCISTWLNSMYYASIYHGATLRHDQFSYFACTTGGYDGIDASIYGPTPAFSMRRGASSGMKNATGGSMLKNEMILGVVSSLGKGFSGVRNLEAILALQWLYQHKSGEKVSFWRFESRGSSNP